LLQNQDPLGTLRSLMEQRSVFYEQAHSTVDVGGRSVGEIADEILRRYRELH
jgi:shikimate kinase